MRKFFWVNIALNKYSKGKWESAYESNAHAKMYFREDLATWINPDKDLTQKNKNLVKQHIMQFAM